VKEYKRLKALISLVVSAYGILALYNPSFAHPPRTHSIFFHWNLFAGFMSGTKDGYTIELTMYDGRVLTSPQNIMELLPDLGRRRKLALTKFIEGIGAIVEAGKFESARHHLDTLRTTFLHDHEPCIGSFNKITYRPLDFRRARITISRQRLMDL
jgi:hypothetical protein